ncbi:hypothetical protein SAMN04487819_102157 [Actinopolyspora alba]|uniref:Uncharacterized protein n=1 Tax=Actinopolyspora alba TaxID=673379 RepID=A0A1I1UFP5_9ACTN|nr:hypothetical protein SAMN04487819_102157 [Actinopolyspora alba]
MPGGSGYLTDVFPVLLTDRRGSCRSRNRRADRKTFDQQSSSMFDSAFCSAESTLRPQTCFTLIQLRAYTQW